MKKQLFIVFIIILIVAFTPSLLFAKDFFPAARTIEPLVNTAWLEQNSGLDKLVIIDVRMATDYAAGHIPNSINLPFEVPFCAWLTMRGDLLLEMPDAASINNVIGASGITMNSMVVLVGTVDPPPAPPYSLAAPTRVAMTLAYAGLKNIAILDGGFPKWMAEGKPVTTAVPFVTPVTYTGKIDENMIASVDYVERHLGRVVLIDARDADVYFGVTIEPWAQKAGHIPTARSFPIPWIWNTATDGTYKPVEVIKEMAAGIIDQPQANPWIWSRGRFERNEELFQELARGIIMNQCRDNKEIIVYCGVGGYASSMWFILTQVLEYKNVKVFDGASQEWVKANDMVKYTWTR